MKIKVTIREDSVVKDPEEIQEILKRVSTIVSNSYQRKGSDLCAKVH